MFKRTQTIRWLFVTNFLSVFDHFMGLEFKRLMLLNGSTKEFYKNWEHLLKFDWKALFLNRYSERCQISKIELFAKILNV